jgi:MYXO-CTERM domain-containing protein
MVVMPQNRLWMVGGGVPLLGLLLMGCGPDDDRYPALDQTAQEIVSGSVDYGDPAVVALSRWGQAFCSATLITPTVVLTAAHCLPPNIPEITNSYGDIEVFFGTQVGNGTVIQVVDGWTNPAWDDDATYDDIGLVRLASAGPATPLLANGANVGQFQAVRIIGFGVTSANASDSGTKREGTSYVQDLDPYAMILGSSPSATCFGDSGGPTLADLGAGEVVIGVHSRSDCQNGYVEMRVDGYINDINTFIGQGPSCSQDGQCAPGCPAPDPDCPCASDGHCTAACPTPADDPDCVADCSGDGQCNPECGPSDPDCAGVDCTADGYCNPACTADPDCGSGAGSGLCQGDDCRWIAGDEEGSKIGGDLLTSCSLVTPTPEGETTAWLSLGLLGLLFGYRRRRSG